MKKFTNHTAGLRGINTKAGVRWVEQGQTVEIDPKEIVGDVPDLGRAPVTKDSEDELATALAQVDDLTKQVEALNKDKADLTKQVETLTKKS